MNRRGGLDAPVVLVRSDGDPRRHRALGNRPVDAAAVTGDRVAAPRSARDDCDGGGVQLLAHAAADIAQHDELVVRCLTGAQNQ